MGVRGQVKPKEGSGDEQAEDSAVDGSRRASHQAGRGHVRALSSVLNRAEEDRTCESCARGATMGAGRVGALGAAFPKGPYSEWRRHGTPGR